jgi:hypothetical protein
MDWRPIVRKIVYAIPALIVLTFANVIIAFCVASCVFFQIVATHSASNEFAGVMALLAAIVVHLYIRNNHRISKFIIGKDMDKNE